MNWRTSNAAELDAILQEQDIFIKPLDDPNLGSDFMQQTEKNNITLTNTYWLQIFI